MQHGHLREPAIHPAFAAAADKDNVAVGQIGRLKVVERAGRDLA